MRRYIALLHPDGEGGYGVSFPDFPGCISGGDDMAEAADQAAQALRLHVEGMIQDGAQIPEPRSAEDLKQDAARKDWFEDAVIALVPLLPPRARAERLNISLDSNLVREIDAAAKAMGMNRSAFLATGAQRLLEDAAVAGTVFRGDKPFTLKGIKWFRADEPPPTLSPFIKAPHHAGRGMTEVSGVRSDAPRSKRARPKREKHAS